MTPQPPGLYNLVFLPDVAPGRHPDEVADTLARLFGQPKSRFLAIFQRAPIIIRRDMERSAAIQLQVKLEKAGAQTRIVPATTEDRIGDQSPPSTPAQKSVTPESPTADDEEHDLPFFFFVPRAQILFPPRCACCFREAPDSVLPISSLGTAPETTGNTGAGAGWIMGGLAGALVGKMVEDSVREAAAGARRALDGIVKGYDVPICSKCAGTMKREGDTGLWEESARRRGGRCRCLAVDPGEGYLAVKFEQPAYSRAFAAVNHGFVSTDLLSFERQFLKRRSGPERGPEAVTQLARYMRMSGDGQQVEDRIARHLRKWIDGAGYFIAPEIPPHLLESARRSCGVTQSDKVLGIISCPFEGSMEQCIAITAHGVYFSNEAPDLRPRGCVSWDELDSPGTLVSSIRLEIRDGAVVDLSRCRVAPAKILLIIESIRMSLHEPASEIPSGPIPLPGASLPSEAPPQTEAVATSGVWVPSSSAGGREDAAGGQMPDAGVSLGAGSLEMLEARLKLRPKIPRIWIGGDIPKKKLANASASCGVQPGEVLCLVDCTVFGSAKNCLLVTGNGIHYHNDFKGGSPVGNFSGHLSFDDLARRQFRFEHPYCIFMGETDLLEISSVVTYQDDILGMLNDLKQFAVDRGIQ